jgi:hypothetical protein
MDPALTSTQCFLVIDQFPESRFYLGLTPQRIQTCHLFLSSTDLLVMAITFFWCMMAAQRGWSIEETASKLLEVSAKAQERARLRDEGYALTTAQNAASAAERGRQRGRG